MKKSSDYLEHANECRMLATKAPKGEHRNMLLKMAETWESLARDREEHLARQRRLDSLLPNMEERGDSAQADPGSDERSSR